MSKPNRLPSIFQIILILGTFLGLASSFTTVLQLPVQLALFAGWFLVIGLGLKLGHDYRDMEKAACRGIHDGMGAILILLSVGILTGTWIAGGIVPTIIYYGLKTISPMLFLPTAVIICSITALGTGTSWGAAGTAGIAMMGIGESLGIPAPITAGAVLSGVYFGDKLSPLSDSVVLAAGMSGVDITSHIRGMLPISLTSYIITLILFTVAGLSYGKTVDLLQIDEVIRAIDGYFTITWLNLAPVFIVLILLAMKKPAFPVISFGAFLGIISAILIQDIAPVEAVRSSWELPTMNTDVLMLDRLLSGGGMFGMLGALAVIVFGLGFGSLLEKVGVIRVLADKLEKRIHNEGSLTTCTIFTGFIGNLLGSAMYVSLILTPRLLRNTYDRMNADRRLLSRNSEFGGTLTSGMVPWSDNGIFMTGILGVSTFDYLPYMWLSFTCIIVAIGFSYLSSTGSFSDKARDEKNINSSLTEQSRSSVN